MLDAIKTGDARTSDAYRGFLDNYIFSDALTTFFSSTQHAASHAERAVALSGYFYLFMTLAAELRLALLLDGENDAKNNFSEESEGTSNQDAIKVGDHVFKLMSEAQSGDFLRRRREKENTEFMSKIPKPPKTHVRFVLESKYSEMNTGRGL
ncbi:MAG: hypothetical protein ABW189_02635 [Rickettsiales bacterium]